MVTVGYSLATSLNVRVQRPPARVNTLFLCTKVNFLRSRLDARSNASRITRSAPRRVFKLSSVAISASVPSASTPPAPTYGPSVPSRTTTKSIGAFVANGPVTPGIKRAGRKLI